MLELLFLKFICRLENKFIPLDMKSFNLKNSEVLELLKQGNVIEEKLTPDFGTSSLFKPIRQTGKYTSSYSINDKKVHHKTFKSLRDILIFVKQHQQGLCNIKTYKLKIYE